MTCQDELDEQGDPEHPEYDAGQSVRGLNTPEEDEEEKEEEEALKNRVRSHAKEKLSNDDLEVDDDAKVSLNDEGGAWVAAWVYVRLEDLNEA